MVGWFRRSLRRAGYDFGPFPGRALHWERIVTLLATQDIDHVFDVGANAGQYAQALRANGYGGPIVSFEPLSGEHARLEQRAARDADWTVAPRAAVGDTPGTVEINISGESDMSSILPLDPVAHERLASTRSTGTEDVPVVTLADAIAEHAPAGQHVFVKSDTQGYEDKVLDGIGDTWERIAGLQLELSIQPIYEGQPGHLSLLERIAERGFRPHLVVPGYWSRHYGRMLEYDVVCFRD